MNIYDPRTVARNMQGLMDELFPHLTPGTVTFLNQTATIFNGQFFPENELKFSSIDHSVLFELGSVVAEEYIKNRNIDWKYCYKISLNRQIKYFDVNLNNELNNFSQKLAQIIGQNIFHKLNNISSKNNFDKIIISPKIPGLEWIGNGFGDFSIGNKLIEIKCTNKNFSSSDYRQIALYWLLSYAKAIESNNLEWEFLILFNPRSRKFINIQVDEFLSIISNGRTKAELLQLFLFLINRPSKFK